MTNWLTNNNNNKLCAWRHNMPPPPASWQYLRIYSPGDTCSGILAIKTSATSWPLTFWPWNWCRSHVWRGVPLCQFYSRPICSRLRSDVGDRRQTYVRSSLNDYPRGGGHIKNTTTCDAFQRFIVYYANKAATLLRISQHIIQTL